VVLKNPEDWAKKPETFICNGPFKMEQWKSISNISFVKNARYWDKKNIKLSRIEYKLIQEPAEYFSDFTAGQLDFISSPPTSEIPNLIKNSAVKVYPYLGVNCLLINISDNVSKLDSRAVAALKDVKVRQALSLAINRQDIDSNMIAGVKKPAVAFVPKGISEDATGKDFRIKGYFKEEGDVTEAKKLLAEAGYPGGKGFPTLTYNYEANEDSKNVAEVIQNMWKKNLGINIKLKSTESKVFTKNITSKGYILSNRSFIGEYVDPMTFLDTWTVANKNNYINYNSSNYEVKVDAAKKELDLKKRMKLLHESEDILMADMSVIPLYFYTNLGCGKEYVKNVQVTSLGIVLFDKAYISLKQ
jgi:oligopeptide transport system substrate-binding protein